MPTTTFNFSNYNVGDVEINVYRSTEPFDGDSLPGDPVDVLPSGSTVYETQDVLRGESWYYLFESLRSENGDRNYSRLYHVAGLPILTGPGSPTLIAGDHRTGFYGEVPPEDLISGADLAAHFNLTGGRDQSAGVPWLKFNDHNTTLFVAKQTFRYSTTWNHINNANLVFGSETIELFGHIYSVRLLTGMVDPDTRTAGGEWNRLMYPIHVDDPNQQGWEINYTNADLNIASGSGRASWTQETDPNNTKNQINRGYSSVTTLRSGIYPQSDSGFGWRPVLEYLGPV